MPNFTITDADTLAVTGTIAGLSVSTTPLPFLPILCSEDRIMCSATWVLCSGATPQHRVVATPYVGLDGLASS
jgi:hypothetical protein